MRSHLPHRKDANHGEIKRALEMAGYSVQELHAVGNGVPDLLAAKLGDTFLVEIKTAKGKLNKAQVDFIAGWKGRVEILTSVDDVIALERAR